jgi:hypothetical protein
MELMVGLCPTFTSKRFHIWEFLTTDRANVIAL